MSKDKMSTIVDFHAAGIDPRNPSNWRINANSLLLSSRQVMIKQVAEQIADLLVKKDQDYGADNIKRHGTLGVLVRMDDKLARLTNLQNADKVNNEAIEDTWKDLAGYAIIGYLLSKGLW